MIKHTFKVAKAAGATQHDVSVNVPTFAEMTKTQRENLVAEGLRSVTIKAQGTLRRRLNDKNPTKPGAALNAEAQNAFDNVINGTKSAAPSIVLDATVMGFTREQIDALTSQGATVVNIPAELAGK